MKRFLAITILFIVTIASISAVSYEPSVAVNIGIRGAQLIEPFLRTSILVTLETEIPTISINESRISIPIGITLNSKTPEFRRLSLYGYLECFLGLSYEYRLDDTFSLGSTLKTLYRYYGEIDSALMGGSVSLNLSYYPTRSISLVMPLELSFLKGELDYTISIGTKFIFGGKK